MKGVNSERGRTLLLYDEVSYHIKIAAVVTQKYRYPMASGACSVSVGQTHTVTPLPTTAASSLTTNPLHSLPYYFCRPKLFIAEALGPADERMKAKAGVDISGVVSIHSIPSEQPITHFEDGAFRSG